MTSFSRPVVSWGRQSCHESACQSDLRSPGPALVGGGEPARVAMHALHGHRVSWGCHVSGEHAARGGAALVNRRGDGIRKHYDGVCDVLCNPQRMPGIVRTRTGPERARGSVAPGSMWASAAFIEALRLVVAGLSSDSGKTLVSLAL